MRVAAAAADLLQSAGLSTGSRAAPDSGCSFPDAHIFSAATAQETGCKRQQPRTICHRPRAFGSFHHLHNAVEQYGID